MQTSPEMKKPPLLRRRAAHLALFVAAAASAAACSPPPPPPRWISVEALFNGAPLTVRTDAPVATRHFRVRVSANRAPSEPTDLELHGQLTSHWRPDDPTEQRKPVIRGRFNGFSTDWNAAAGFGLIDDMSSASVSGFRRDDCDLQQAACEWLIPLDIEVQPKNTTGAVDVQWSLSARASVSLPRDEELPGFAVQVTEE